jgi:hypothetical protein
MSPISSFVARRILGQEAKNRVRVRVMLEEELVVAVKLAGLDLNDTLNIALEDRLKHRKYSDAVTSVMAST